MTKYKRRRRDDPAKALDHGTWVAPDGTAIPAPKILFGVKSDPVLPEDTRSTEHFKIQSWHRLCRNQEFRADISALQQKYPAPYWSNESKFLETSSKIRKKFWETEQQIQEEFWKPARPHLYVSYEVPWPELSLNADLRSLCTKWGIEFHTENGWYDAFEWLRDLLRTWDLSNDLPPTFPKSFPLSFMPCVIYLKRRIKDAWEVGEVQSIELSMQPWISKSQAETALKQALKYRTLVRSKPGKPSLTDIEKSILQQIFEQNGIPANRKRNALAKAAHGRISKITGRPYSLSVISNALASWLRSKGERVKNYNH